MYECVEGSLFNGISTYGGYLMPKPYLYHCSGTNYPISAGIRRFNNFPKGISLEVNVIARLEIELTYFEAAA